eukprot:scaffold1945_cov395-Prasinococcus_capsulatus_cf.AAC.6
MRRLWMLCWHRTDRQRREAGRLGILLRKLLNTRSCRCKGDTTAEARSIRRTRWSPGWWQWRYHWRSHW